MYFLTFIYNCRKSKLVKEEYNIEHIEWLVEKLHPYISLLNIEGKGYCLEFQPEYQRIYLKDLSKVNTMLTLKQIIVNEIVYSYRSAMADKEKEKEQKDFNDFVNSLNEKQREYFMTNYIDIDSEWL